LKPAFLSLRTHFLGPVCLFLRSLRAITNESRKRAARGQAFSLPRLPVTRSQIKRKSKEKKT
jgi:hypothetical protein